VDDVGIELLSELECRVSRLLEGSVAMKEEDLAINGQKVMEVLEMSPGPQVGQILAELLDRVTEDPKLNSEKDLVSLLRRLKG
jgi:tRNA nucleotidyltransferase (CCA-adding enzyme)